MNQNKLLDIISVFHVKSLLEIPKLIRSIYLKSSTFISFRNKMQSRDRINRFRYILFEDLTEKSTPEVIVFGIR